MSSKLGWQLDDWLSYLEHLHPQEIDLGLKRVAEVYHRLDSPCPAGKIIIVAGTNGKGSVTAHITALATAAGLKAGSYTSPHLLTFNERFSICGQWAGSEAICKAFIRIETARVDISLSYFEFSTLAGILLLADQLLDVAVFEVGLGGRLDAVNILDADCAVITSIALDHQDWLGDTLDQIAREKAGIFRCLRNNPNFRQSIIIGEREPPPGLVDAVTVSGQGVSWLGTDFDWRKDLNVAEIKINCRSELNDQVLPTSPLAAPVQNDNLAVAFCALSAVAGNLCLDMASLTSEFNKLQLRGRLEKISSSPDIYVDVAHNPAAAEVLVAWLKSRKNTGRTWAVCAMLKDKDSVEIGRIIDPWVAGWYLAGLEGPRGQTAESLQANVARVLEQPHHCYPNVPTALQVASELAATDDLILVFGSFLTVEQAIRYWNE